MASPISSMRPLCTAGIKLANGIATTSSLASMPSRLIISRRMSGSTPAASLVLESIYDSGASLDVPMLSTWLLRTVSSKSAATARPGSKGVARIAPHARIIRSRISAGPESCLRMLSGRPATCQWGQASSASARGGAAAVTGLRPAQNPASSEPDRLCHTENSAPGNAASGEK